jgi:hypothetical protein
MKFIALFLIPMSIGCGATQLEIGRATLTTAAYARVTSDRVFADAYQLASEEARRDSTTQVEKDAKMVEWEEAADEFERAISLVDAALTVGEIALDGLEQTGDPGHWDEALACVAVKLKEIADVLDDRNIGIPAPLAKILALTKDLVCSVPP